MDHSICPKFESATEMLSKRWVGLIIHQLLKGPMRFKTLESTLDISPKVLSDRLKYLETRGVVKRDIEQGPPLRSVYSLTQKGQSLKEVLDAIESWAQSWV